MRRRSRKGSQYCGMSVVATAIHCSTSDAWFTHSRHHNGIRGSFHSLRSFRMTHEQEWWRKQPNRHDRMSHSYFLLAAF